MALRVCALLWCLGGVVSAWAGGPDRLVQAPRVMGMGGAFIGLADDEFALFYNPAGLAGIKRKRLRIAGLTLEGSSDIYSTYKNSKSAFSNPSVSTLGELIDKDIYARGGITPILSLPHFALAYVVDGTFGMYQTQKSNPTAQLIYRTTHGIQAGFGKSFKWGGGRRSKKSSDEIRVGMAAKVLWRRGGTTQVSSLDLIKAAGDYDAFVERVAGGYHMGMGVDIGAQAVKTLIPGSVLSAGVSITDIADTKFSDRRDSRIPMNAGIGVALTQDLGVFTAKVAADYQNIFGDVDIANRTHLGAELGLPFVKFQMGFNQLNFTYGAHVDFFLGKWGLTSFARDLGPYNGQRVSRTYMLSCEIDLPLF